MTGQARVDDTALRSVKFPFMHEAESQQPLYIYIYILPYHHTSSCQSSVHIQCDKNNKMSRQYYGNSEHTLQYWQHIHRYLKKQYEFKSIMHTYT